MKIVYLMLVVSLFSFCRETNEATLDDGDAALVYQAENAPEIAAQIKDLDLPFQSPTF